MAVLAGREILEGGDRAMQTPQALPPSPIRNPEPEAEAQARPGVRKKVGAPSP